MDRNSLAIVIPAHNESATIGDVIAGASAFGSVIVIDDGSTDDTYKRAINAGALVYQIKPNKGYEAALSWGIREAIALGYKCVVTVDADGEHNPCHLGEFRKLLVEDDIPLVLGIRRRKQRFAEWVFCYYVKVAFGADDILCGMKGYSAAILCDVSEDDTKGDIGTFIALNSLRNGNHFVQIRIGGEPRKDAPRFDQKYKANIRILKALLRAVQRDIRRQIFGNTFEAIRKRL